MPFQAHKHPGVKTRLKIVLVSSLERLQSVFFPYWGSHCYTLSFKFCVGLHRSGSCNNDYFQQYLPFSLGSRVFLLKTVLLRNYVMPKRSDQLIQVKEAVRRALLSCDQRVADGNGDQQITRFEFFDQMTKQVLDLESNDQVCFVKVWMDGSSCSSLHYMHCPSYADRDDSVMVVVNPRYFRSATGGLRRVCDNLMPHS